MNLRLLLSAVLLVASDAFAQPDPGHEPPPHLPFELPFEVTDAVFDPVRPFAYVSSTARREVHFVDLETGRIERTFSFALMPEHLAVTPDGTRLFAALLTRGHDPQRFGELEGYIASFDLAQRVKDREFRIAEDPFDLVATTNGQLVVSHGSGQWGSLRAFDAVTGALLGSISGVYHRARIALHPGESIVYTLQPLCPGVIQSFDVGAAGGLSSRGSGPGKSCGGGDVWASPRGDLVVAAAGHAYDAGAEAAGELAYLGPFEPGASSLAFDPVRNTLFTGNGATLFHHNLNSLETVGSTSLAGEIDFLAVRDLRVHALVWDGMVSRFVEVAHPLPQGDSDGPPTAALAVVPPAGLTTLDDVTFDASASADLEGPVLYRFDVKDDGSWDTGFTSDPILVRRFSTAGPHRVRVRVKDSMGNVADRVATADVAFARDPGGPGELHLPFRLPFEAAHGVIDPLRPYAYVTSMEHRSLYVVSLATGLIEKAFRFDVMPERMRLSRDGAQLYVALLAREHSPFWWEDEQEGYIARFDLEQQEKDHQFWIPLDPFDLVPTSTGELIVTSGSGQHTLLAAFDVASGERRGEFGLIWDQSTLALHPSEERFYTADGPVIPQDLRRWDLLEDGGVELAWDSIYHGDHHVGDGVWMSPIREEVVTAGGDVFSTDGDSRDTDLLYRLSAGPSPLRLLDLAWETTLSKWAAIDTDFVRVHDLSSHRELERFVLPGTGRSVGFHAGLVFALQVDGDESRIDVFVPDNRPPRASMLAPSPTECDSPSGAEVLLDAAGSGDPDSIPGLFEDVVSLRWFRADASGAWLELGSGQTLRAQLPLGSNLVELRVTDHAGATRSAQTQVEIIDTTPPVLTIAAQPPALPASGKLVTVRLEVAAQDACGGIGPVTLVEATTNATKGKAGRERPVRAGRVIKDAELGTDDRSVGLRAGQNPAAPSRVYRLRYTARDERGLLGSGEVEVPVVGGLP